MCMVLVVAQAEHAVNIRNSITPADGVQVYALQTSTDVGDA